MNLASVQYTFKYESFEIYLSGCKGDINGNHCIHCHNPELFDFSFGHLFNDRQMSKIHERIEKYKEANMLKMIWVLGGEPLDQNLDDLMWLLREIRRHEVPIYLFTGKEKTLIRKEIIELCDFLKCGKYIETLKPEEPYVVHGIELHSTNQNLYTREELLNYGK